MSSFVIVEGDTLPSLQATLTANGAAVDLTGATVSCVVVIGTARVTKSATLVTPASGIVSVTFGASDLPVGNGLLQFQVTFADSSTRTFPSEGGAAIRVVDRL